MVRCVATVPLKYAPLFAKAHNPDCDFAREELNSPTMSGEERRRVPRYSARLKATVKLAGQESTLAVLVEDLCVLGCLLEYGPTLQIHQECDFSLMWKGREFRTPALIAWKGDQGQVGMEFHDTSPENHEFLREICPELFTRPLVRLSNHPRRA